jgi:hypothetical protein
VTLHVGLIGGGNISETHGRAAALIAECDKAGVKLGLFFQDRFAPAFVRLKQALDEGALGRIVLASARVKWWRPPEYGRSFSSRTGCSPPTCACPAPLWRSRRPRAPIPAPARPSCPTCAATGRPSRTSSTRSAEAARPAATGARPSQPGRGGGPLSLRPRGGAGPPVNARFLPGPLAVGPGERQDPHVSA